MGLSGTDVQLKGGGEGQEAAVVGVGMGFSGTDIQVKGFERVRKLLWSGSEWGLVGRIYR
jgi:hypothetical protein